MRGAPGRKALFWLVACSSLFFLQETAQAQKVSRVSWIWFNEGDPLKEAPAGSRFFRRTFHVDRFVDEASLDITSDTGFTVWLNGHEVGKGNQVKRVYAFEVKKYIHAGTNAVAVEAHHTHGPAGLLVRLNYVPNGTSKTALVSNGFWKVAKDPKDGWQKENFNDDSWSFAKSLGSYEDVKTWTGLVWDAGGDDRFSVPPGFRVEMVAKNPNPKDPFSLINMTFDNRGRLLVSQERGPILLCTKPDKDGVFQSVKPYCNQVQTSHGMCWVNDALLLVGEGPKGTGLYRVRDTDGDDRVDEVTLVLKFKGSIGEHGPHAIFQGPDNCLYQICGNHSWALPGEVASNSPLMRWPHGQMGPDQNKPGTTEDVLLPRQNDARGHAADILAPGGTIWRLDGNGKNISLVNAGFRNHFDAAFSPMGELFTFDSDMEWDEGLPWYRAVRICHCPPGADFVWRTGAANTPDYYIDSLAPAAETGRGSPVGMEFYDHRMFPEKYRGACFMGDWSLGLIYAVHFERQGASYKAKFERFCSGNPLNVTDMAVGPDGALYFTMGGRGTQGGVYRIVYPSAPKASVPTFSEAFAHWPQPLSAWSRNALKETTERIPGGKDLVTSTFLKIAGNRQRAAMDRVRALIILQEMRRTLPANFIVRISHDPAPEVRAHAVWLLGLRPSQESAQALINALSDSDDLVRRRACEALIRAGIEPPLDALWPLLGQSDRFVRTAARLVLQRIDPAKWVTRVLKEENEIVLLEGIVALCKIDRCKDFGTEAFKSLAKLPLQGDSQRILEKLRTIELALVHASASPEIYRSIAQTCLNQFPHADWRVNRELAILLTHFASTNVAPPQVNAKMLEALLASRNDRKQQIHYFYCLRLIHAGWKVQEKDQILTWYDSTKSWEGGHSFVPFLENILRDANDIFTADDRTHFLRDLHGENYPLASSVLLRMAKPAQLPAPEILSSLYLRSPASSSHSQAVSLRQAVVEALGQMNSTAAQEALRKVGSGDPSQQDAVARSLARFPSSSNWPYLVRALKTSNPLVLFDVIQALKKCPDKPKADDPAPFRNLLVASGRLDKANRWKVVELLRYWSPKSFGAEEGDWQEELTAWNRWFGQAFPKEPSLPTLTEEKKTAQSKYKFEELLSFLEKDNAGRNGDVTRGRLVFQKAQCIKCHKFGKEGEGVGPDLTTVSKRFKRVDLLESVFYPSKVISDQYRSTVFVTKNGQTISGLAAPQGNAITVLQSDANKIILKKEEIAQQFTSLISAMPEKLFDPLTKEEISDLFAFLESEPK